MISTFNESANHPAPWSIRRFGPMAVSKDPLISVYTVLMYTQKKDLYTVEEKTKVVAAEYEEKDEIILFFKSSWCKIASAARNWSISVL